MRLVVPLVIAGVLAAAALPAAGQHREALEDVAAEGLTREERDANLYTGLGLSWVSTDFTNLSEAVNLNLTGGAHLPWLTWLSGEVEISFTVSPGTNHGGHTVETPGETCVVPPSQLDPDGMPDGCGVPTSSPAPGTTASSNDLQMTNVGAFTVLRTPGPVYAMGRFGYRYINSSIRELDDDKIGPAWSGGAGYRWRAGLSKFEVGYTRYSEHIDYLGVAVVYGFGGSAPEIKP